MHISSVLTGDKQIMYLKEKRDLVRGKRNNKYATCDFIKKNIKKKHFVIHIEDRFKV